MRINSLIVLLISLVFCTFTYATESISEVIIYIQNSAEKDSISIWGIDILNMKD